MRLPVVVHLAWVLAVLRLALPDCARGQVGRTTLESTTAASDLIIVAVASKAEATPERPGICRITLRIHAVLKGQHLADQTQNVNVGTNTRGCADSVMGSGIAFLQASREGYHFTEEGPVSWHMLASNLKPDRVPLAHFRTVETKLVYAMLTYTVPHLGKGYGSSIDPVASTLASAFGMRSLWNVLSYRYLNGSGLEREEICLLAAGYGACIDCARRVMARRSPDTLPLALKYRPLDSVSRKVLEEADLAYLGRPKPPGMSSRAHLDYLEGLACASNADVREAARRALRGLSEVSALTFECPRCSSNGTFKGEK